MIFEHVEIVKQAREYFSGRHANCLESRLIAGLLQVIDCNVGQVVTVYTVHKTLDDHGALGALVGVTKSEMDAREMAVGHGWFRSGGKITSCCGFETVAGIYLLQSSELIPLNVDLIRTQDEVRKGALAKLTSAEMAALGIKDPLQNGNL